MKTTLQNRLARLAGLLVLSLLVSAIGIQAAQAASSASSTTPARLQGLTPAQIHHYVGQSVTVTVATAPAGTKGRGGVAAASIPDLLGQGRFVTPIQAQGSRNFNGRFQPTADVLATRAVSSGTTATSAWVIAGSAAALLIIGLAAWTLTRRQQPGQLASASFCNLHPDDSLCTAA